MTKLRDLASLIRSKNAGPFEITFDIMFRGEEEYRRVKQAAIINAALFARMYQLPEGLVQVYEYDPAFAYEVAKSPGDAAILSVGPDHLRQSFGQQFFISGGGHAYKSSRSY